MRLRKTNFRSVAVIMIFLFAVSQALFAQTAYRAPANSVIKKLAGERYYSGEVFLPSPADTALLSALGFRNFEFHGRSVSTVKYGVLWPTNADLHALPPQVSGITFDEYPASVGEAPQTDVEVEAAIRELLEPNRIKTSSATSSSSGPGFTATKSPREVIMSEQDFRKLKAGSVPYWSSRQTLHVRRDPHITGNFMVEPVEDGPFHKPENVGTADPSVTGNFQVTPYSTLQRTGIGSTEYYHADPMPGGTFTGVPDNQPRDEWRGVGSPPHYRGLSMQEYLRQKSSQRRR